MKFLLDTCVISELVAKRPDARVTQWIERTDEESLYLSVITIGEIRKGIAKLTDPNRKSSLATWLNDQLLSRFAGRIVPIDTGVMLEWGELVGRLEQAGKPLSLMDSLIAATVLHGDFTLVTRNEDDFRNTGRTILNPWASDLL